MNPLGAPEEPPPRIKTPYGDMPDFAKLFVVPTCACGDEDCEICAEAWLTPRTALVLHAVLELLADEVYDDVGDHGSEAVDEDEFWRVLGELPELTWGQDAEWRRRFARSCDDLAGDLARGRWPVPRCPAEEMALHLALARAPGQLELEEDADEDDGEAGSLSALPEHPGDHDWNLWSDCLFEDHDILMLFDVRFAGVQNPGNALNQSFGVGDLRPEAWFRAFYGGSSPRDPSRGFRR
ncbi:hypothetical protein LO762_04885 [Actinocorallia sp. API 0066]|uniref:hypothetical protein n=1 Tax=Actinocorallia sp. API 0066 TaxID=2896846 RepID=UPI001E5E46FF|nr:hypothetical protein [Actinocorallia sp. API 0066]MCD0448533.1 hypothetical protein [Actinocorallia sp. API 0066]